MPERALSYTRRGHKEGGFTLIETIISIGLFLTVFGITVSAIVSVHSVSNRVQSTTAIIDSMSFVINDIVRNSRIAQRFWCGTELNDGTQNACGGDSFTFQAVLSDGTVGSEVTYRLNSGTSAVEKSVDNGIYAQLTSDRLTIDHMNFEIFDAAAGDARPTRTLITLVGTYEKGTKDEVTYRFQTTVTQRVVE